MKTGLSIALGLCVCALSARAEDVKFVTGKVMHNVTVRVWPDGLAITPPGFAQTATKYPWAWIDPADAARLKAQGAAEEKTQSLTNEISGKPLPMSLRVIQVFADGYLGMMGDANGTIVRVFGSARNVADDITIAKTFYPTGRTWSYESASGGKKTVFAVADSVENAVQARAALKPAP